MKRRALASIPLGKVDSFHQSLLLSIGRYLASRRAQAYVVGGYVRDVMLGLYPSDIDIAVSRGSCEKLARWIHKQFGFSRPVRFKRFETFHLAKNDLELEIAPLVGDLNEDAQKRDFTINSLYVDLIDLQRSSSIKVLDPTKMGIDDLKRGILRTPAEPFYSFWLDPVRLLRSVRFVATLGVRVNSGLEMEIARAAYLISRPAPERIRAELEKILASKRVKSALRMMERTRLLRMIIPDVANMVGYSQRTPFHAYDLFEHTLRTVSYVPPELALRLSALLHDVGKPATCRRLNDRNVYYGHADSSARIARDLLTRLRFPGRTVEKVEFLISNHMVNYSSSWTDKAVRRFVRKMGKHLEDMLLLIEADRRAQKPDKGITANITELRRRIEKIKREVPDEQILPIDGHGIMEVLGIKQGPQVGEAKGFLLKVTEDRGRVLTRKECEKLLRRWIGSRSKQ